MSTYFETPSDTGVTHSDAVALITARFIADTGVTNTDSIRLFTNHVISDTGITSTDSLAIVRRRFRTISDTGCTIADQFVLKAVRPITTTGVTQTDSLRADIGVVLYSPADYARVEGFRNWSVNFDDESYGWTYSSNRIYSIEVVT